MDCILKRRFPSLRYDFVTKVLVIPPKLTSVLHPLDISLNSSFKAALRRGWLVWLVNGSKEITAKGYRRQPSYQAVVDMVLKTVHNLSPESIRKSFRMCDIAAVGEKVPENELNERLKHLLVAPENIEEASAESIIEMESHTSLMRKMNWILFRMVQITLWRVWMLLTMTTVINKTFEH